MLYSCIDAVERDLDNQRELHRKLKRRKNYLEQYDGKSLVCKMNNGNYYYYEVGCLDGKSFKRYLNSSDQEKRKLIQEYKYIELAISRCEKNIESMERLIREYKTLEPDEVAADLGKAYREQENANKLIYGYESGTRWVVKKENEKKRFQERHGEYMEDSRKHVASDGTKVASKSELAMKELLISLDIPRVYEYPIIIQNRMFRPDFIVLNTRTGQEYFLEHIGYFVDEIYRHKNVEKLHDYISRDIVPNKNLLLTFENTNGEIDVQALVPMLNAYLK